MQRTNSLKADSGFLPPKSLGATTCILNEAPNAKAPSEVQIAARKELKGKVDPERKANSTVDTPVAIQNTR